MYKKPLVLLLSVFIIALLIHFSLRSDFVSEKVVAVTAERVEQITGARTSLNAGRLNLVPTFVELDGVTLDSPDGALSVVRVDRIRVSLSLYSLLTRVMFIKNISLLAPEIHLRKGSFPLEDFGSIGAPRSTAASTRKAFVIREIEIRDGKILYEDPSQDLSLASNRIGINIKPSLKMDSFQTSITAEGLTWTQSGEAREFESILAEAVVRPDQAQVKRLEFSSSKTHFSGKGNIQDFESPRISIIADASVPFEDLHQFFPELKPLSGHLRISGNFSGSWPDLSVRGTLSSSELSFKDLPVGRLETSFAYGFRKVSLYGISSSLFGGKATGKASLAFGDNQKQAEENAFSMSLSVEEVDIPRVIELFGASPGPIRHVATGRLDADGTFSESGVDFESVTGKGDLSFRRTGDGGVLFQDEDPFYLKLLALTREGSSRFDLDRGILHVKNGDITTDKTRIDFIGEIETGGPVRLDVDLATGDMGEIMDILIPGLLSGELQLAGRVTGTPGDPAFNGFGKAHDFTIRNRPFESGETGLSYEKGKIQFNQARIESGGGLYEVEGALDFNEEKGFRPGFDIKADIRNGDPRNIISIFTMELPVLVQVTGKLTARGNPKKFVIKTDLKTGPGTIYGQPIDSGSVSINLTRKQISFKNTVVRLGDSTVEGQGVIRFNKDFEFSTRSKSVDLQVIEPIRRHLALIEGPVSGRFSGRGTFSNPLFEGDVTFKEVRVSGHSLGKGRATGQFKDQRLSGTAALDAGLTGRGNLDWETGFPFGFELHLNKMDLKNWFSSTFPGLKDLSLLSSTGTLKGTGRFRQDSRLAAEPLERLPVDLNASVSLDSITMGIKDYTLENNGTVELSLNNERINFQSMRFRGPGTVLNLSGTLTLFKVYNLFLAGEADLNLLRTFTQEFTYGKGRGYLALQIAGPWSDPELRGGLTVHDGSLTSRTLGQSLAIRSLVFSFNEHQAFLEEFEAGFADGTLQTSGRLDLEAMVPTRFALVMDVDKIRVKPFEGLSTLISASFNLEGDLKAQSMVGDVRIHEGTYKRRIDFQAWVREVFAPEERPPERSPLLKNVSLKIEVHGTENIAIQNNLAQIPLEINLTLTGTLDRPLLNGQVFSKGGKFSFRRHEFQIESGLVDINTGGTVKTRIDLRATTRVRNYTIDMTLVGPITRSDLTFTSNPPLKDQNEVFCLLTFNKPCEEIPGASRQIGAAEASAIISGEIENLVSDRVAQITGLDEFKIDPFYSPNQTDAGPMITIKKSFLDQRFQVSYGTTLDPTQDPVVLLEYFVSNNVSISGSSDEEGRVGGDLIFHLELR
ncbi:MAG TPA: translocation/assembly module TamB domain-containing protein [Nitrospiria bacterium]